jgi:acyl-CoA synthetase (AMP-forming)/AMP-acid ligase II
MMNFGDLFDSIDSRLAPDVARIIEETPEGTRRTVTSSELRAASNNLARGLRAMGLQPGDKVAFYGKNSADYLISVVAAIKARLVHVNVNYRYEHEELRYLLDNSDARCVVFDSAFRDKLKAILGELPLCEHGVELGGESPDDWALSFDSLAGKGDGEPLDIAREPEDLIFMYTGGTTGMPKGVMWEQCQMWNMIGRNFLDPAGAIPQSPEEISLASEGGTFNNMIILPFMHGGGLYTAINALGYGNLCVLPISSGFDPDLALSCIDKHAIMVLTISGDAFATPLINALQDNPGKYGLQALKVVNSTAMIFSNHNKKALLKQIPELIIFDNLGSSESPASAMAMFGKDNDLEGSSVVLNLTPNSKVFTEDLREVQPGSGEKGFLASTGALPLGYYKDEAKTAATFITVDGVRYSRPGDWVEVLEDGSVKFLGRGSVSINSGGEKIYPDEVESVIKSHPSVDDCVVVGVADERFGQAVTAVVQPKQEGAVTADELRDHVRSRLSGYKVPKHVLFVAEVYRAPNGKVDYPATKALAEAAHHYK